MAGVIYFNWSVPEAGFRWDDRELKVLRADRTAPMRASRPLRDEPALFRRFADLPAAEEAILAFANQYGCLGIFSRYGDERRTDWQREIAYMKSATEVWDLWRAAEEDFGKEKDLRHLLTVSSLGRGVLVKTFSEGRPEWALRHSLRDDPFEAARAALAGSIVNHVGDNFDAMVTNDLKLYLRPRHLLAAMWFQLHLAINSNREYSRCALCETWFFVHPKASGRKRFCSTNCRVKAHQARRKDGAE